MVVTTHSQARFVPDFQRYLLNLKSCGFSIDIGEIELTECQDDQWLCDNKHQKAMIRGYGLTFGATERKAMSMALLSVLCKLHHDEPVDGPAQDEEFVLSLRTMSKPLALCLT